jgi:Flp pilus assembly protein TadG
MRSLLLSLGVAAALALGACGGDDNKSDNASTTTATTQTTGTTTDKTTEDGGKKKGKSGSSGGSKSGGNNGGGGSGSSGGGGTTTRDQSTGTTQSSTQPEPTTPSQIKVTPFKTAKKVCAQFLPEPIKRQIRSGKVSKETVAKNYAKGYPADQRNAARKGCLAGLNTL